MEHYHIKFIRHLAEKNVALVTIDNLYFVAKSPKHTNILLINNILKFNWLNSNSYKKKTSLTNFNSEVKLHLLISENLKSENVIIPKGKLLKSNIFLMEFVDFDKRSQNHDLDENIDAILKALTDIQLVFKINAIQLKSRRLLKQNDILVFYKNGLKTISRCKNSKSVFQALFLMNYFTRLYFTIEPNKTFVLSHGDLRSDPYSEFSTLPTIRNLGFEKESNKIVIYDFGSSQTESKIIFKDIVKIFNHYPKIEIYPDAIRKYFRIINKTLKLENRELNKILEASIILCFFAEFSAAVDRNQFKSKEINKLFQKIKSKNYDITI